MAARFFRTKAIFLGGMERKLKTKEKTQFEFHMLLRNEKLLIFKMVADKIKSEIRRGFIMSFENSGENEWEKNYGSNI